MLKPPPTVIKMGAPEWVVTFGDLMSLLLTFFVLLLSFSNMEAQKFKVVAGYMREAFGLQTKDKYTGVPMGTTALSTDARTSTSYSEDMNLIQAIRREMERAKMTKKASVRTTERGVAVRIEGEALFDSGQSELKAQALELLDGIAELAADLSRTIEVEGHTDNIPIASSRYPSNWELSSARAGSATRYMIEHGVDPPRIRAVGYADTRPLAPNTTPENRALNRRVELLFIRHDEDSGIRIPDLDGPKAPETGDPSP